MPHDDDSYDPQYKRERQDSRRRIINLTNPPKPTETQHDKPQIEQKYSKEGTDKLFIQTLNHRKKRRRLGELDQDYTDNMEVGRMFGGSGEGVTNVDERTMYYSDGSWHG